MFDIVDCTGDGDVDMTTIREPDVNGFILVRNCNFYLPNEFISDILGSCWKEIKNQSTME